MLVSLDIWARRAEDVFADEDSKHDCSKGFVFIYNRNRQITNVIVNSKHEQNTQICQILLEASANYRLRATVNYFPSFPQDCQSQFLHIGNDKHRPNELSLTSYKFCNGTVSEEIVSRDNFLWITYSVREAQAYLRLAVTANREVICNERQFQCSPIQCVEKTNVCDTKAECHNGRDEYCVFNEDIVLDEPCFRCGDGSCIRPTLPRYDDDWGKPLWFLCDNVEHCKDGTDERPDVCTQGKRDEVIKCHPAGQPDRTEIRWKTDVLCDNEDCVTQEDDENCDSGAENKPTNFFIPTIIVAIAVTVVAMGFCIIHKRILLMNKKPSDEDGELKLSERHRRPHNTFNLCQAGRPSLDTEEKQCFISTV